MNDSTDEKRSSAEEIVRRLRREGFEAYFVGGCVRDFLRGVVPGDYDIVTSALPDQVKRLFERTVAVGAKFGVIVVVIDGRAYEVATYRSDGVYEDGRRPAAVSFSTAREDVLRRDFTVNGLLMDPFSGEILDYVGGRADIDQKVLRTIGDPDVRFGEDRLRMLRAVRFAANLGYALDLETQKAIARHTGKIREISAERIAEELQKILTRGGARKGFERLSETGLLQEVLPEVEQMRGVLQPPRFHPEGDVWEHTMILLDLLSSETAPKTSPALAWAALLHDVGKPLARTQDEKGVHFYGHAKLGEPIAFDIALRLRFSRTLREQVIALIRHHMAFMNVQKMRPSRLKKFLRMPDFDLHLQLHRLDCLASHGMLDHYAFCVERLKCLEEKELHPPRFLTGNDLLQMGFAPGKAIGKVLLALEEEQLENRISSKEEALAFAGKYRREHSPEG